MLLVTEGNRQLPIGYSTQQARQVAEAIIVTAWQIDQKRVKQVIEKEFMLSPVEEATK